jgi:NHLM bacteriocin system ABC transporter ATP-binding protein
MHYWQKEGYIVTLSMLTNKLQAWRILAGELHIFLEKRFKDNYSQKLCLLQLKSNDVVFSFLAHQLPPTYQISIQTSPDFQAARVSPTHLKENISALERWRHLNETVFGLQADATPAKTEPSNWDTFNRLLSNFQEHLMLHWCQHYDTFWEKESVRLALQQQQDQSTLMTAIQQLTSVLEPTSERLAADNQQDILLTTCQKVCREIGVSLTDFLPFKSSDHTVELLSQLTSQYGLRIRQVRLSGQWWLENHGPLLAYRKDGQPVALLPTHHDTYDLHDTRDGSITPINATVAEGLNQEAMMFYKPFPDRPVRLKDVLKLSLQNSSRDWLHIFALGILSTMLMLLLPYGQKVLVNTVLPLASYQQLTWLIGILTSSVMTSAACFYTRDCIILRILGKSDYALQSALWDRVLKLPVRFFKRLNSGELTMRILGVQNMRYLITVSTVSVFLSIPLSLLYILLIATYSKYIALYVLSALLFFLATVSLLSWVMLKHLRQQQHLKGKVAGLVLQFILGIAKIRTSGCESRIFGVWAKQYAKQQEHTFQVLRTNALIQTWSRIFPYLATLFLYLLIARQIENQSVLSTGDALVIMAAFGSILGVLINLVFTLLATLMVIPLYERLQIIFDATPESTKPLEGHTTELRGEIEGRNLKFRYQVHEKWILNDLNLHINAHEYIAIVGSSGSGKSTFLRILLGFETLDSGAVYLDNKDLRQFDIRSVRNQIGVVMQNSQLIMGNILENITGNLTFSMDEVWAVAEQVGLADEIKALPMGMFTYITDSGNTLSGAQRQLILIARALIQKPSIMILDEATSFMDNVCQARITLVLKNLKMTRIVIAQRLSTIREVDQIYVLKHGKIVETGNYQALLDKKGEFSKMVEGQLMMEK